MIEVHQTNILTKCCRVCGSTAPKYKIVPMKKGQADWFGIETTQYKICENCSTQVQLFKDKKFDEVQEKFGLTRGLMGTICTNEDACWFCFNALEWKETKKRAIIPNKSDSQNPKKPKLDNNILKKFFQKRLDQKCTTVALEPFFVTDKATKEKKRLQKIYRIMFHGKMRSFLWDDACKSVFTFNGSSSTGIKKHMQSKVHQRMVEQAAEDPADDILLEESSSPTNSHHATKEQWKEWRMIMVQGLFGTGKFAPAALNKPLLRQTLSKALSAIGVVNDINEILPSTTTAIRMIQTAAYDETMKTKQEIREAIAANPNIKFTLLHDDGTLRNGNNENLRTFAAIWIDQEGCINRRYLKSTAATEKDANAIKNSVLQILREFHIDERYVFLTDAASVNISVASQLNADLAICGPHTLHNTVRNGLKEQAAEDEVFRNFFGEIKTTLSKASRKHLNHRMLSEPGWIKMQSYVETRWCSLVDCLNGIVHNWDYLQGQAVPLIQNNSRQLVEEFYQMMLPFKYSIKAMESTKRTSGHLVAIELNQLLIYYINYSNDKTKPTLLQNLAKQFVNQIEYYMDGTPQRRKRICSIRLLQSAFYLPSGYLDCFNVQVDDEMKQSSINARFERLHNELNDFYAQHTSANTSNHSRRSSFGDTQLKVEVSQFSLLAQKYHENDAQSPDIIKQFKLDEQNKLDANLNFWMSDYSQQIFPCLRDIILPLLSVSASTSLVEGTFSFANHIRTSTRSKLNTETLNNYLTCLYATFDN